MFVQDGLVTAIRKRMQSYAASDNLCPDPGLLGLINELLSTAGPDSSAQQDSEVEKYEQTLVEYVIQNGPCTAAEVPPIMRETEVAGIELHVVCSHACVHEAPLCKVQETRLSQGPAGVRTAINLGLGSGVWESYFLWYEITPTRTTTAPEWSEIALCLGLEHTNTVLWKGLLGKSMQLHPCALPTTVTTQHSMLHPVNLAYKRQQHRNSRCCIWYIVKYIMHWGGQSL